MVLLTLTPFMLEALAAWKDISVRSRTIKLNVHQAHSSLVDATVGDPISHIQITNLWKDLQNAGRREYSLEMLLKGAVVYRPPPPPKPEPSPEYKALMARLRREEEQRAYERMTNPPPPMETFSQRFPGSGGMAKAFASVNQPIRTEDLGDDDVTYADVHRQLMLILNFVASILGVAATLWILARWWSTPARLFLTLGGSALVGIAEFAVYQGYIWHLGESKRKDKSFREVKEVVDTWVVEAEGEPVTVEGENQSADPRQGENAEIRRRKKDSK